MTISPDELRTLQLGPLWVLSALAGRCSRFDHQPRPSTGAIYGWRTTPEDEQMILLIAALLEVESAPGLPDEVLV